MNTECIEWTGTITDDGYGRKGIGGKDYRAHRLAYCAHQGVSLESIRGMYVLHSCDNRRCVNPLGIPNSAFEHWRGNMA